MCGILVSFGPATRESKSGFLKLLRLLEPRGPDGLWHSNLANVTAGFTRLSIFATGVSLGDVNPENEPVQVLLNGEIWNHAELKRELDAEVRSEFELVRAGYIEHGIDFVRRLDGMFFLTILDRRKEKYYFARDPIGIKPAFYYVDDSKRSLLLASDIKPLAAHPMVDARINENYLINQSVFSYSDYEDCLISQLRQIPPGHYLQASLAESGDIEHRILKYKSSVAAQVDGFGDPVDAQLHLLEQAVRKRCDHKDSGEVGLLLSGGIDSSLIAFIARRLGLDGLLCFYMGERDTLDYRWAAWVAEQTGYRLEHVQPRSADVLRNMPRHCYELSGERGYVATVLACEIRRMHPNLKIVLCGEGSDELYAGYSRYLNPQLTIDGIRKRSRTHQKDTALIRKFKNRTSSALDVIGETEWLIDFLLGPQLVNNHLLQLDHGFMAHALELRVPFLDLANVAYARDLPIERKVFAGQTKTILKDLASTVFSVPDDFLARRKTGLPASLPSSIVDMESYAKAILPTNWRESHTFRDYFSTSFEMFWFDLTCIVLLLHGRLSLDAISINELYSDDNIRKLREMLRSCCMARF